jgi:hypothetical protein
MNRFTKLVLVAITALAAVATSFEAKAQGFAKYSDPTTVFSGGTNNIPGNSTNLWNPATARIDVPKAEKVALYVEFKLNGAGTSAVGLDFGRGFDGSSVESNAFYTINFTAAGTTLVNVTTNIDVGAVPYLHLLKTRNLNAAGSDVTNLVVKYGFKN